MKKILLIISASFLLSGCSLLGLPNLVTPKAPDTRYDWKEIITTKPKAVIGNGEIYVVEEINKELIVGYKNEEKKLTFMQKIGNWFSRLSFFAFIAIIIGLILFPSATIGLLINQVLKWKKALKETVSAIQNIKKVSDEKTIKNILAQKQSTDTKMIIDKVKREIEC